MKNNITNTYSGENTKSFSEKKSKKQMQYMEECNAVKGRMDEMKRYRSISCPYQTWSNAWTINEPNYEGVVFGGGFNWEDFWAQSRRLYRRQRKIKRGRSNLKSSIIFSAVEAFMSEAQQNEIGILYVNDKKEYADKVKMYKYIDKAIEHKYRFPQARKESWKTAAICGTAITYTGVVFEKNVKTVTLSQKELDQEKEDLLTADEETIKKYESLSRSGKPRTKEEVRAKLKFIRENVPLEEVYFDPDATCIKGQAREAVDVFRERRVGCEEIKQQLLASEDPYIDKEIVKTIEPAKDMTAPYDSAITSRFESATQDYGTNKVLMKEYWNKITDKYIIFINDALVRYGPMPYNHGELPFQIHKLFEDDDSLYGVGFGWVLMDLQAEKDATINQQIESVQRARGNYFYDSSIESDMDQFNTNDSEQKIGFDADGRGIGSVLTYVKPDTYSYDRAQLLSYFDTEAIKLSGINTIQLAMPASGEPVRNNMMAQESSQRNIQKLIENWAVGEIEHKRQLLGKNGLIRQFITKDRLNNGMVDEIKNIKLTGVKLEPKYKKIIEDNKVEEKFMGFDEKNIVGEDYLEVFDEYIDNETDIDFIPVVDTWLPESKSLRINNVKDMSNSLSARLLNPDILTNPLQVELIRAEIEEVSPPNKERLLDLLPVANDDDEEERAEAQNELIQKSVERPNDMTPEEIEVMNPRQGESKAHLSVHAIKLSEIAAEIRLIRRQLDMPTDLTPETIDPQMQDQIIQDVTQGEERIKILTKMVDELIEHLAIDEQPEVANSSVAAESAMRAGQGPEMQGGETLPVDKTGQPMLPEQTMGLPPELQVSEKAGSPRMPEVSVL